MIEIDNNFPLIAEERRAVLLRELNDHGFIQAAESAKRLGISVITIRRDLELLEEEGLCIRKRGGAVRSSDRVTLELPYEIKRNQHINEKKRIGQNASTLVKDGNTIILDAGSTTFAMSLFLRSKRRISVVTNDLQIAVKLASNPGINLICTGGIVRPNVFSLQGREVVNLIEDLHVDTTFLGADAIHEDLTITNVNFEEVPIKQAMIRAAKQVVLIADSSKFNRTGFVKVCSISEIDKIITDRGISESVLQRLNELPVEVQIV
ncbi:MAG: DeoR/GlpR family DNA-binding transcription regulator [Anaerolineaceae bacterium]|jgi:DeoR/GlpR family transcriptional regulator of sugar metabolism